MPNLVDMAGITAVHQGLDQYRTESRLATTRVGATKVTGSELKNVERALQQPPKNVDWLLSMVSVLSPGFFGFKTLRDAAYEPKGLDLAVVIVAFGLAIGIAIDIIRRLMHEDINHKAALEDVRKMIAEQAAAVTQPPPEQSGPQSSGTAPSSPGAAQ